MNDLIKMSNRYISRGSDSNEPSRFLAQKVVLAEEVGEINGGLSDSVNLKTIFYPDKNRTILTRNQSPDIGFGTSINPYKGCEHGCVYCFARPTHAYLDLSPGIDFETRIFYKTNAAELLRKELDKKSYVCTPIAMGTNTDPYQPGEKSLEVTRQLLTVLLERRHPVTIVTKSTLIERDLDILADLAAQNLVSVNISITTLSKTLKNQLEPRTASPQARLRLVEKISAKEVPIGVLVAPIIPFINDQEIEDIVSQCSNAGAQSCSGILLRLPLEVKDLFEEWLQRYYPLKRDRVMSAIRNMRGGKENDPRWFSRMRGEGPIATMIWARFAGALKKAGIFDQESPKLDCSQFVGRGSHGSRQLSLI